MSDRGFAEYLRLKKIAGTEEHTWIFPGLPAIKTVPRHEHAAARQGDPFPDAFILTASGKCEMLSDRSKLPGWHPAHICGMFCDGQDGNGECLDERHQGPPKMSPLEELTRGVWFDH